MNKNCRFENVVNKCVVSATEKSKEHVYTGVADHYKSHHVIQKSETQK